MIGETVSHYRIIERLGSGGMGIVYLAEDTVLGRRVAIKTLTDTGPGSQHFRVRFLREARAVSALSHPHIATIHDYGETPEGQPYIVMEFIKGATLADLMLKESLTIPRALEIVSEVAEALGEAHNHGIIHRDIKPSNIAINQRGEVKVLDFGLAKQINPGFVDSNNPEGQTLLNTQTREGVIVGTPMYLSPEQALGVEVDRRSDLFSLGAVLYECLAGKPPFLGGSPVEICAQVIRDEPAPPSQFNSNVSPELDRIALKALAKKPDARYQTAAELITDLHEARAEAAGFHQTITRAIRVAPGTQPTGAMATLSDIFRRPRLSVGYVAAGLVAVLIFGSILWKATRPTLRAPSPEAQRLYERGVEAMRQGAFFKASKLLQQAVETDPAFALAHARLAEAWMELDSSDKAKDALIRANDLVPNRSALSNLDHLRFQGITNTVKRDFVKAVEDYGAIASAAPANEKGYALFDLGRAYERNEQSDKALENFQEAAKADTQNAAAFLRLGILLGRRGRFDEANSSWEQANKLFDVNSDIEGLIEVLLQRAVLLGQQSKIDDARLQLLLALEKSNALENKDKKIKVLLNLSNTEILASDPEKAEKYSSQALDLARTNGLDNLTMQGLIDIGNFHFIKGNFPEAEKNFNDALRLAELYKGERSRARALLSLSSLRSRQGDPQAARHYFQLALPFYEQGGYRKEIFQANVILGRAEAKSGEFEVAQKRFEELLRVAQQGGDPQSIALAHEGLGRVFLNSQRYPQALEHYNANYEIVKALKATSNMGYTNDNRAIVLGQLGHLPEARKLLQEALAIAQPDGKPPFKELQAQIYVTSASLSLIEGRIADALSSAQKALDLSATYKSTAIEASYVLSRAESFAGKQASARKRSEEAVNEARKIRDELLLSMGLLALAEAALAAGDYQAAAVNANEAHQRFAKWKQHESEWRALLIRAQASDRLGDKTLARRFAQEASAVLTLLEQQWGGEYFRGYVDRPDIRSLRSQLTTLLTP